MRPIMSEVFMLGWYPGFGVMEFRFWNVGSLPSAKASWRPTELLLIQKNPQTQDYRGPQCSSGYSSPHVPSQVLLSPRRTTVMLPQEMYEELPSYNTVLRPNPKVMIIHTQMQSQQCCWEPLTKEQSHGAPPKQVLKSPATSSNVPEVTSRSQLASSIAEEGAMVLYLMPGKGGIWLCGVDAGVGGFKSPPSAMELLVDWGVWGPCIEPEPAARTEMLCKQLCTLQMQPRTSQNISLKNREQRVLQERDRLNMAKKVQGAQHYKDILGQTSQKNHVQ